VRTEIFIEGIQLDLSKDISSEYSFNIDDVKDFASRNTSYSKTIVIPGNAINNKIFGHIFQFGSSNPYNPSVINVGNNFNAAKSAACIVFIEKTQIFKGILRLLEIIIDGDAIEYECVVFGELGGFVSAMGNARLEDLDMSVINGNNITHNWTLSNATQSWDNASGYYYPLIDYGNCSTNKHDWDIKALRPALYVKDYVDKIFEFTGYTYESTFFNTDLFKRLIIPNNSKQLLKQTTALVRASYSFVSNNWLNINAGSTLTVVKDITYSTYTLSNFTSNGTNFTSTNVDPITGTFAIFVAGAITVTTNGGGNMFAYCKLYKNNVLLYQFPSLSYVLFSGTQTRQMYFNGTPTDTINQNDTYRVEISVNIQMFPPNSVSSGYVTLYNASLNIDSNVAVIAPLNYGDAIDINSLIPKGIFMREFIASLVKMFNLYIVESKEKSKHLIIKPFITFYVQDAELLLHSDDLFKVDNNDFLLLRDGSGIALDWTYKVDRSKPIRLKPMSEINGRYFEYKYKPDNDYYNEQYQKKYTQGYGDTIVDTGYEFAKEKQTAEVIFAATPLVGYTGEDKIYPTILKITNSNVIPKVEESTDHVVRIMQRKKVTGVNNYDVKNGATVLGTLNTYGYAGHLDDPDLPLADINFGAPNELYFSGVSSYPSANLYNGYWSEYVAEISDKDSKLLTCNVKLNNVDIYNLNFTFLIFIDGALWRLNKIIDYNPNEYETTKVELLKVIELSYV
jgi:hypothetical protein